MSQRVSRGKFGIKSAVVLASFSFFILSAAMTARASLIPMTFTGAEGNQSGGVYTYPYEFNINSSSQTYPLMCDDYLHEIMAPQSWNANTLDVSNLNATTVLGLNYPGAGVTGYLEASYLFVEEATAYVASNSDPEGLYNWAVWDLMTNSDVSGGKLDAGDETTVQGYLAAAEAAGPGLTASDFSNVIIYTPTDMSPGGPQEFFGYGTPLPSVPEPSTFALLGIGAVGLMGRWRRKAAQGI
jgi:hypothetical protein